MIFSRRSECAWTTFPAGLPIPGRTLGPRRDDPVSSIRERAMIEARRHWMQGAAGMIACAASGGSAHAGARFEVEYTDVQWRTRLNPEQYAVLRESGTERAYTSPLNREKRRGTYACA